MNVKQFLVVVLVALGVVAISALALFVLRSALSNLPSSSQPSPQVVNAYSINRPNALMLVDSQGRRTGRDPVAGVSYHEIPGTDYFEEFRSGQLYFTSPPKDRYTIYVLGGQTGEYVMDWKIDDGGPKNPERHVISGEIQKGAMVVYAQDYNPTNIASSALVFQGTDSSTASVTTDPPHNLPLP